MSLWDAFRGTSFVPAKKADEGPKFEPKFRKDVFVVDGNGKAVSGLAQMYALEYDSALELAKILADLKPTVGFGPALDFAPTSPFQFTAMVPFLEFADFRTNAGPIATNWVINRDFKVAEAAARRDLAAIKALNVKK